MIKEEESMKSRNLLILTIVIAFNFISAQFLSIQGVLRNEDGSTVEDGVKSFRFTVYDAESGGNEVWQEIKDQMQITNGVYTHTLGSIEDFSDADPAFDYSQEYWLAIKIDNGPELTPRTKLTMTPTSNSVVAGTNNVFPSDGNVGVGTTSPGKKLDVRGSAAVESLYFSGDDNNGSADIQFKASQYGDGIYMGGGGETVIASGEFADIYRTYDSDPETENLILGSDKGMVFFVSDNDYANKINALSISDLGLTSINNGLRTQYTNKFSAYKSNETSTWNWMEPSGSGDWMRTWMAPSGWAIKDNGGDNRIIIKDNGNVGIGADTTPDAKLDVQGDLQVDGFIKNADGENQWRLVKIEEFNDASHGWTHNGTNANAMTTCNSNQIFGGYNQISGAGERMNYTWTPPSGTSHVKVVMDIYAIDSWDAEWMWLELYNNIKGAVGVFSQQHAHDWAASYSGLQNSACGSASYNDRVYRAEVSARYDGSGAMKLVVSNNLGGWPTDESIGIDNVEIWVR